MAHGVLHANDFRVKTRIWKSIQNDENATLPVYLTAEIPAYLDPEWQAGELAGSIFDAKAVAVRPCEGGEKLRDQSRRYST